MKIESLGLSLDHEAEFLCLGLRNEGHVLDHRFGLVVNGRVRPPLPLGLYSGYLLVNW